MPATDPPHSAPHAESATAFGMLNPGVQKKLWDMKWTELRALQADSIVRVLTGDDDLILSAGTASGKTEAAFLPILSAIANVQPTSLQAMYVGPLKALINDQFGRVEKLSEGLGIAVHHWHGDVAAGDKARLIKQPSGILLITPESIESLFINRSEHLARLFSGLRFVVIDELHSFLDNERGLHLRSLLARLDRVTTERARRIALSATIGNFDLAKFFINPDQSASVQCILGEEEQREIKLRLHAYAAVPPEKGERPAYLQEMAQDLVKHCQGASNLVFANSKATVEEVADLCHRIGEAEHLPDRFLVHHGSLSAELREDAEESMKSGKPCTAFCSSTLEMGIDIGAVKMVGQIGAPSSAASLAQRMGRSGRRPSEPRVLRMYVACEQPDESSTLFDRLHLDLIQAIAVTQLTLQHWVEPPSPPSCDLSTLTQQILSVIAQTGGVRADRLHDLLCIRGPFRDIAKPLFAQLLRQLAAKDVIEQEPQGDLIMGLLGEQIRKDKGFYAVFATPKEYAVLNGAEKIGRVFLAVEPGEYLLLGGRRWRATGVDQQRLEIYVQAASGWKPPRFSPGDVFIDPKIRQEMRTVLTSLSDYVYLDSTSHRFLADARHAAESAALNQASFISLGPSKTALMTWTGNRIQTTLRGIFASLNVDAGDEQIALVFKLPRDQTMRLVQQAASRSYSSSAIAACASLPVRRKYDWLLSDELRLICAERDLIDLAGATALLAGLS